MKLYEVLNEVIPFHLDQNAPRFKQYSFEIGPLRYIVEINRLTTPEQEYHWIFSFMLENTKSVEITNTGNQFQVFATVIEIIKDFLELNSKKMDTITFTAANSEPSRVRLYKKLASKFILPGYKLYLSNKNDKEVFTIYKDIQVPTVNIQNMSKFK